MGTTAEKGARVLQSIAEVQEGINNLGGSLTDQTPFKDFKAQLDNIYDNLPKTEYQEGTEVNLGKTSKGKLDYDNGVVGIGQSSQDSTQGYNLSNFNTDSQNGISYNINTIKIVNPTSFNYADNWNLKNDSSLSGNTYSIYMCVNGTKASGVTIELNIGKTGNGYAFQKLLSSNTTNFNNDISVGTITLGANEVFTSFNTYLSQSVTANLEVKVMVVKGSYTTSTIPNFEPYTNGASPNPTYPQEIKYVRGKNLLKLANGTYTSGNVSAVVNNGIITLNGTSGSSVSTIAIPFTTTLNGEYTLSANNEAIGTSSNWTGMRLKENSSTTISSTQVYFITANASATFTLGNKAVQVFELRLGTSVTYTNYVIKPQLEKGTQATPYLPYNTLEEVVRGKNYVDNSDLLVGYMTAAGIWQNYTSFRSTQLIEVEEGNGYYTGIFDKQKNRVGGLVIISYDKDKNFIRQESTTGYVTVPAGVKYIQGRNFQAQSSYIENDDYLFQIEDGYVNTGFEPYQTPQTYQLSLGEYEFNGIGDYKDELVYDVDEDRVYKNEKIGKKIFTGASDENWAIWQGIILIDDTTIKNLGTSNSNFYLNYFRSVLSIAYIGSNTGQRLHINLSNSGLSEITTPTAWKTWLSTHNLEFVYVCNETLTEITDQTLKNQVKALYNAHSNNGTTIITSNGNLPIIVKVRALKNG